jgi:hypothetical protein
MGVSQKMCIGVDSNFNKNIMPLGYRGTTLSLAAVNNVQPSSGDGEKAGVRMKGVIEKGKLSSISFICGAYA